jgi:hypothetical protein
MMNLLATRVGCLESGHGMRWMRGSCAQSLAEQARYALTFSRYLIIIILQDMQANFA